MNKRASAAGAQPASSKRRRLSADLEEDAAATHLRFDDDEDSVAPVPAAQLEEPQVPGDSNDDDSDSDEAPEAVTADAARTASRAAAASRAQAAERERTTAKQRRREQDKRLKERSAQQHGGKKTQKPDDEETPTTARPRPSKSELPELLPASILEDATLFAARPPTPPPASTSTTTKAEARGQRKNKIIKFDDPTQPARDRREGDVTVRTLPAARRTSANGHGVGALPGRAKSKAKAVRESWLGGRGAVARKAGGSGFLVSS